jgi:uncharacterized protein YdiU (UPF0061 family)
MKTISSPNYKSKFITNFPGDLSGDLRPRQTPDVFYSKATPTPVADPKLLAWSAELANELGIQKPSVQQEIDILAGNAIAENMQPYAARYGGHQFGNWAGQLGDGRAITLGEWVAPNGKILELQLKGGGPTAYSRRADGRAVLRSSVREYLMSEAMHYLGVPTTRALSLVSTGDQVLRDMFYNGNAKFEPGAIVMRAAPSFLRFGNFEILAANKELENLRKLTDWTIAEHYPHITGEGWEKILAWFSEIVERTATMIVEWLRVGFVHGVMNTDNMSILGLTIDYGPYSFLDDYDPDFTPNTTDLPGRRYAFGNQASIAYWNLSCLASAIAPLFPDTEELVAALEKFGDHFYEKYQAMMANKLGLDSARPEDEALFAHFEETLSTLKPDMTIFYQKLIDLPMNSENPEAIINHFQESFYQDPNQKETGMLTGLIQAYLNRISNNSISREESQEKMRKANPRFILRNYLLHQAIQEMENGENSLFLKLQQALQDPYCRNSEEFFAKRPAWAAQQAGCSMLSCSS